MLESGIYEKGSIDVTALMQELLNKSVSGDVGAITTFIGVTKRAGLDGKMILKLEIESYEDHANEVIKKICMDIQNKYDLSFVKIYHLVGEFLAGEPLVFVAIGGRSRETTFAALHEAVERYKKEPALFKKEVYVDGSYSWISHP